jgi:hypothetical protein
MFVKNTKSIYYVEEGGGARERDTYFIFSPLSLAHPHSTFLGRARAVGEVRTARAFNKTQFQSGEAA